jgi:hypothetical protein
VSALRQRIWGQCHGRSRSCFDTLHVVGACQSRAVRMPPIYGVCANCSGTSYMQQWRAAISTSGTKSSRPDCRRRRKRLYRAGEHHVLLWQHHHSPGGQLIFNEPQSSPNSQTHLWASSIIVENEGKLYAVSGSGQNLGPYGAYGGTLTIHLYGQNEATLNSNNEGFRVAPKPLSDENCAKIFRHAAP